MRTRRPPIPVRQVVAAVLLLAGFTVLSGRPAAAAVPAARVLAFGGLPAFPELTNAAKPVVGIAAVPAPPAPPSTPTSSSTSTSTSTAVGATPPVGYWLVAADGGVFPYGDAIGHGSAGAIALAMPMVGMASTPTGDGYWLVAADGGVFPYGPGAPGLGSMGGRVLNKPVVGIASTPTGKGYWLVAADGGIFPFGDAGGYGSTGALRLNQPIVGMAATPTGKGYWLVGADGGIFPFGDAQGYGSVPGTGVSVSDVSTIARSASGAGFVIAAKSGRVWAFGDAIHRGSTTVTTNRAVVGVATSGTGYWLVDADAPPPPPPPPPPAPVSPPLPPGSGVGRRVVYCNSCHRVWLVESNGAPVRSYLVSGRYATPRAGSYSVYSKSRLAYSTSPGVSMEYMVRFAYGRTLAIGFHAIPRKYGVPIQTESQLGTFRSAGCVRQADRDALALWNFAPVGTRVVVTP